MNGISYYAINQWQVAGLQPPHLSAICVWEGAGDWYRDKNHHGGILCTFQANWSDMQIKTVQHGLGTRGKRSRVHGDLVSGPETLSDAEMDANRGDLGGEIAANPLDNQYHRDHSADWDKVKVPLLSCGNWGGNGLHLRGNIEGFVRAASKDKWLEMHGDRHWTLFYTDYGIALQKKFFGHFLKGEDTGWAKQPRVLLNVRHPGEKFVLREENEWPLARTQWTKLYLSPSSLALSHKPRRQSGTGEFRRHGRRPAIHDRPAAAGNRDHRPVGAETVRVVLDRRRRPVRGAAGLRPRRQGGRVPRRARSAYADRPGLAARVAPQARQEAQPALPALSHAR